jgi:nucleotide-binding universal stress UspA family protein
VGSQGLSGVSRFLLGSVSNNVARHAGCPVLIGRTPQHSLRQVVLAVDESEHAAQAAAFLARLPLPVEAEIIVVQVVRPFVPYGGIVPTDPAYVLQLEAQVRAQRLEEAEKRVGAVQEQLQAAGRHAATAVRVGDPAAAILDLAAERRADLIVAGARGVSLIKNLIVGSVADQLLKSATCSVLLVHAPQRAENMAVDHEGILSALRHHAAQLPVFAD